MATLAQIEDALSSSLQDGQIDLRQAATKPALTGVDALLGRFAIPTASWPLNAAAIAQSATTVTLGAKGQWAPVLPEGGTASPTPVDVTLTATAAIPTSDATFTLALAPTAADWTIGTSFSGLPGTLVQAPGAIGLTWQDSALSNLRLGTPVFSASEAETRLRVTGSLTANGALAPYADWTPFTWPLTVAGVARMPTTEQPVPLVDLLATARAEGLDVGIVRLDSPGFRLAADPGDPHDLDAVPASALLVSGELKIGTREPVRAVVEAPLLATDRTYRLMASFDRQPDKALTLKRGLAQIEELFGLESGTLTPPAGLSILDHFQLSEVEAWLGADSATGMPTHVQAIVVEIVSEKDWSPPIPFLEVIDVGTRWAIHFRPDGSSSVAGTVFGSLPLEPPVTPPAERATLDVVATVPGFTVFGQLGEAGSVTVERLYRQFFGGTGSLPALASTTEIVALEVLADPAAQTFALSGQVETQIPVFNDLKLSGLVLSVLAGQSRTAVELAGYFTLGPGPSFTVPTIEVGAAYTGGTDGGWEFHGALYPTDRPVDIGTIWSAFTGSTADATISGIGIERLAGRFAVGGAKDGTWDFSVAVKLGWQPEIAGTQLDIAAGGGLELAKTSSGTQGTLTGYVAINRLSLSVSRQIGIADPGYVVKLQFDQKWVTVTVEWVTNEDQTRSRWLTAQLGGVTLGDILEYLVNLAAPTIGFTLEPPWDLLKRVDLSRFKLAVDLTHEIVEITYDADVDLVVAHLNEIGVRFAMDSASSVELILKGSFLGQPLRKPLQWDVVNDPPPAVPGKTSIIKIRYVAAGQRIRLSLPPSVETVAGVMEQLRKEARPSTDPVDPLKGSQVVFDESSGWLLGTDLTVMDTVDIAVIFNDPRLYGVSIGLHGERAGALAGLRFEILYKRITDDIGMYRIELALPEQFRQIRVGAVAVTLGVVVVEIYTNGNFMLDLGFPHQRSFERSFTVQVLPLIGRGGVYLGVLNGATSRRVPAISNGTFSPVLELGVGLAVGAGAEVRAGPLSGGAYVQVEVIFQGVLAWFNPSSAGTAPARYHWAQGIAAIHGKVYGKVDFGIIAVSVTFEASAQVSVTLEAYRATLFELNVEVEAEAEVDCGLFSISFSFSAHYDASFTVGADEPTPWLLTAPPARPGARLGAAAVPASRRRPARTRALLQGAAATGPVALGAVEGPVFPSGRQEITLTILPLFSLCDPPVSWTGGSPVNDTPSYVAGFTIFAPNGVAAGPRAAATATSAARPGDPQPYAASVLIEGLLRWALSWLPATGSSLTAGTLRHLSALLEDGQQMEQTFAMDKLDAFFIANIGITLAAGDPASSAQTGGMPVAAPPYLQITVGANTTNLAVDTKIGPRYVAQAAAAANAFSPAAGAPGAIPDDVVSDQAPFAQRLFRDWCLAVTRGAVREAERSLASPRTVTVPADKTLAEAAATLPSATVDHVLAPGDTVESIAADVGMNPADLEELNPDIGTWLRDYPAGHTITVNVGVGASTLIFDNPKVALKTGASVTLADVHVQVRQGDTLASLAGRFGGGTAEQFVTANALGQRLTLLRAGAPVQVPARPNPLPGSSNETIAATFYVRYTGDPRVPLADWYAQAIAQDPANDAVLQQMHPDGTLPAGRTLTVPSGPLSTSTTTATTLAGDTLLRLGGQLSLAQSPSAYSNAAWSDFYAAVVRGAGTAPQSTVPVGHREPLAALADRLIAPGGLSGVLGWMGSTPVLDPLAIIPVRTATLSQGTELTCLQDLAGALGETLSQLAARRDLRTLATNLFEPTTALTVAELPADDLDTVAQSACAGDALAAVSAQAARRLLGGTRLPAPEPDPNHADWIDATGPPTPLAQLGGVQLPAPDPNASDAPGMTATIALSGQQPNPGWVSLADDAPTLSIPYTNAQLKDACPAPSLSISPVKAPTPMPLSGQIERTYGLSHRVELQTPILTGEGALPYPTSLSDVGNPTLWPFSPTLLAKAAGQGPDPPAFEVLHGPADGGAATTHQEVTDVTWATHLAFTIRRVAARPHVYTLLGPQPDDSVRLLALQAFLAERTPNDPTDAGFILATATPDAAHAAGVTVLPTAPETTFALRTNLATDVAPSPPGPPSTLEARFSDLAGFTRLLWESAQSTSGFHFAFRTRAGDDLPAGIFADDGTATLTLLVIARDQQQPPPAGRTLHAFSTCALVGAGLDADARALYLQAHLPDPEHPVAGEMITQAVVPAGTVGVQATIPRAAAAGWSDDPAEAAARMSQRFSLLGLRLTGTPYTSQLSVPTQPNPADTQQHPAWFRRRLARLAEAVAEDGVVSADTAPAPKPNWRYELLVPVWRFATGVAPPSPDAPGLAAKLDDPYLGFGDAGEVQQAGFSLSFGDILGNATAAADDDFVSVEVGYTDPIVGVGAWPSSTTSYWPSGSAGAVSLQVTVAPQAAAIMPAAADLVEATRRAAGKQAERYDEVAFQLIQDTMTAELLSTLHQTPEFAPIPVTIANGTTALWRYAAANAVYARAAAALVPIGLGGATSVGAVCGEYGLGPESVAHANAGRIMSELFTPGAPLRATPHLVLQEGDTAQELFEAAEAAWRPADAVTLLQLASNWQHLPLRPGIALPVPSTPVALGGGVGTLTLAGVAADHRTTAAQLAIDNEALAMLRVPFGFEWNGHEITTGPQMNSFLAIRQALALQELSASTADLATAAARLPGIFADDAQPVLRHVVAAGAETKLADLVGDVTADQLAQANTGTENLFDAGALVAFQPQSLSVPATGLGATLGQFAAATGTTPGLLLAENPTLAISAGSVLALPGIAALPAKTPMPYVARDTDTLPGLAAVTDAQALDVADWNQELPSLAGGHLVQVTAGGVQAETTTQDGDSLDAVLARLVATAPQATLADVVSALGATAVFLPGALLVLRDPHLPVPGTNGLTAEDAAGAFGLADPVAFAQANQALVGALVAGTVLIGTKDGQPTQTVKALDSLNAILARFAADGHAVGMAELISLNAPAKLFAEGVRVVLPPTPAIVSAPIGDGLGPFATPAAALLTTLRLRRTGAVQHEFVTPHGTGEVERADTLVPAPATPEGNNPAQARTFDAFIAACLAVLPSLRLATGKMSGQSADLWVVDLSASGIASVALSRPDGDHARVFALRPLYRELVGRTRVQIPEVKPDGTLGTGAPRDLQGVDVEPWARRFLADLDLYLSAPYATAIYQRSAVSGQVDALLQAKWKLSAAIPGGLWPVAAAEATVPGEALISVRAEEQRRCGESLSSAYAIAAIAQYEVEVASPYSAAQPAQLRGDQPARQSASRQPFTMAAGPVSLVNGDSYLHLALSVPDPQRDATVAIEEGFQYNAIEVGITATDPAGGYASGDWLTFVRPLTVGDPGISIAIADPAVPIPLRDFPAVPVIVGQSASATADARGTSVPRAAPPLDQAALWTYAVAYSHEHTEQDEVLLTVTFNEQPRLGGAGNGPDLASALARYTAVAERLSESMAGYLSTDPSSADPVLDHVAASVATLANEVATAWAAHWPTTGTRAAAARFLGAGAATPDTYGFDLQVGNRRSENRWLLDHLKVTLQPGTTKPGPTGNWPVVERRGADGEWHPLTTGIPTETACLYTVPGEVPAVDWPVFRLSWPDLNLSVIENARSAMTVRRNQKLGDIAAARDFVLTTAMITAPDLAVPILQWQDDFQLTGTSLGPDVQAALAALFGGQAAGLPITLAAGYRYSLVLPDDTGPGLATTLPVALGPRQSLGASTGATLANELTTWASAHKPETVGGEWTVTIILYSRLATSGKRPLLVLDRLVHAL